MPDFGGPGVGSQQGSQYEKNTALGKVMIITEDFDSSDPHDADLRGSYFDFDFAALGTVTVYLMHIMDVEVAEISHPEWKPEQCSGFVVSIRTVEQTGKVLDKNRLVILNKQAVF